MSLPASRTGQYKGTGQALAVSDVGFKPKVLIIKNATDGDVVAIVTDKDPDGAGQKIVDSGVGTTDLSNASSTGVTLTSRGFTVGGDASLNEADKTYDYVAIR